MIRFFILIFTLSLVVACNKTENNSNPALPEYKINVTGLKDIEILQGFDTVVVPISLDGGNIENSKIAVSVINLPQNLTSFIIPSDTTGRDYNIMFVAYY